MNNAAAQLQETHVGQTLLIGAKLNASGFKLCPAASEYGWPAGKRPVFSLPRQGLAYLGLNSFDVSGVTKEKTHMGTITVTDGGTSKTYILTVQNNREPVVEELT